LDVISELVNRIEELEKKEIRGEIMEERRDVVKFDIERAIVIADQVQDFFKKKKIEPMDA